MLNKPFIEKWALALPSFEQEQGSLQPAPEKYCCLGVACELYRQETGKGEWVHESTYNGITFQLDGLFYSGTLPPVVADFMGLGEEGEYFDSFMYEYVFSHPEGDYTTHHLLSDANDDGCTFTEIRDVLLKLLTEVSTTEVAEEGTIEY